MTWRFTHTHPFNGPLSGTTQVNQYQKGKTNLDFTETRDSEWQRHLLGRMQVCNSLQTDNHTSTPPLSFLQAGCSPLAVQPTASKHWSHMKWRFNSTDTRGVLFGLLHVDDGQRTTERSSSCPDERRARRQTSGQERSAGASGRLRLHGTKTIVVAQSAAAAAGWRCCFSGCCEDTAAMVHGPVRRRRR